MSETIQLKSRPAKVARHGKYQLSITLTETDVDRMERLRIRWAARSWNQVIKRLLAEAK